MSIWHIYGIYGVYNVYSIYGVCIWYIIIQNNYYNIVSIKKTRLTAFSHSSIAFIGKAIAMSVLMISLSCHDGNCQRDVVTHMVNVNPCRAAPPHIDTPTQTFVCEGEKAVNLKPLLQLFVNPETLAFLEIPRHWLPSQVSLPHVLY